MAAIFENPISLVYHVAKSLLLNGVEIFHDIDTSVTDFGKKDYFHSGEFAGEAFALVFFKGIQNQQEKVEDIKDDVEIAAEIMFGFADGVSIKANLDDIKECIEDPQAVVADFEAAAADLKQFWSFSHLRKAFAEIGAGVGKMRDTFRYCPKIGQDVG